MDARQPQQPQAQAGFAGTSSPTPYDPRNSSTLSGDPAELLLQHFPEAAKLTREDMEEMLRSPDYFDAFFGTLPAVHELYGAHRRLLEANQALAEKNTALRERHEGLKSETQAAFDDARRLQERWHSHTAPGQTEAYKRLAPQVQLSRLRQALGDQDRLSESLVASLLDGTLGPDEFARQFREVRRVYYRRAGQVDKWLGGQVEWRD